MSSKPWYKKGINIINPSYQSSEILAEEENYNLKNVDIDLKERLIKKVEALYNKLKFEGKFP
jgi:hypothetical protein